MNSNDDSAGEPAPDSPIYTADGEQIGNVKELRGRHFKVDAPLRPDYWLSRDDVDTATPEAVTLNVDAEHLDAHMIGDSRIDADGNRIEPDADAAAAAAMPAREDEGLLAGEPQPGNWNRAWSVPVGAAWDQVVANYQIDWQEENAEGEGGWETAEPGFRYGHEMAAEGRYAGLDWGEAEPELGRGYGEWAQQHGYAGGVLTWERDRENARRSWERSRERPAADADDRDAGR